MNGQIYLWDGVGRYACAMTVDPASRDYPYRQLAEQYRAAIQSGELGPKLPNMHVLAEQAGVSPQTVQRAINALKAEGLVEAIPGRGVFVVGK